MADQTTETVNQQKQETITKQKNPLRVEQGKTLVECNRRNKSPWGTNACAHVNCNVAVAGVLFP